MIQVQIATLLHEDGVGDIRWVLLDPSESAATAAHPAAAAPLPKPGAGATAANRADQDSQPATQMYRLLRAIVLVLALGGAYWVASTIMAPRSPAPQPERIPTQAVPVK